mmetsp:Transcript_25276/g.71095  ORF Transcript_25276/g.71095 Transcript_25276/m.71095 type:complete len:370 (-) Transcript_25276:116-1225(-)
MPGLCGVCTRSAACYTCPRCQLGYCSLSCYKGHSVRCTESFYQDQVQEELKGQRATGEERRKLERIVAELHNLGEGDGEDDSESGDEDCEAAAEKRLLDLVAKAESGDLNFEDLTEEEAQAFHSELKRGALGQTLGPWEPWWQRAAVVEMDLDTLDDGPTDASSSTAPLPALQHICCPGGREVHASVAFTVLEVLYAYAHTMRAFNGEWSWDPLQAALHLLQLASAVCSRKQYDSAGQCVHAVLASAAALPGGGFGAGLDTLCLEDLARMLCRGGDTGARALREALGMVEAAAKAVAEGEGGGGKAVARLQRGAKKLEFLLSFAFHHTDDLPRLEPQVRAVHTTRCEESRLREEEEGRRAHGGVAVPAR